MNLVFEYIKYRWKAKGRHGTHSPFIYEMVDQCFRIAIKEADKNQIQSLVNALSRDKRIIEVSDFGAGSKSLKNKRSIRSIYKVSSSKGKFATFFYRLSAFYQPKQILELGTSLGIGTIHFSKGNPQTEVITVEACPQTAKIAVENFEKTGSKNIQLVNDTFSNYLPQINGKKFDIIFVDGHHDGEATINYLNLLQHSIHDDTFIILDDIRWSDSMFRSWELLKESETYNVSIDLFRMGILIKRPNQRKEHFVLKL